MYDALSHWLVEHWLIVAGFVGGWVLATLIGAWRSNVNARQSFELGLGQGAHSHAAAQRLSDERFELKSRELSLLQGRTQVLEVEHEKTLAALTQVQAQLQEKEALLAASEARLASQKEAFVEQQRQFTEVSDNLKREFQLLAQRIFSSQGQAHEQQLTTLLTPFREQITDFRRRVDEVYQTDTKERASLLTEMKNLHSASERINQEAENLAKALKGDKKLQGNWGELVLERVLEDSGLRRERDYLLQPARRGLTGELKRPDVIIRLPEGKDVIVDSKASLISYEQALVAEDVPTQKAALKQHVGDLRNHVKRLAAQDYDHLTDVRSLDFVLMFVPIESAFAMAMEEDPRLFNDAFAQRVVVVSPSTLMLCLRIIHNLWRFENQDQNAKEIAARAGQIYDKLRGLVDDVTTLGKQLQTVDKTYEAINGKLVSGKGNLVRQAERFRTLGANVKKPFEPTILDAADAAGSELILVESEPADRAAGSMPDPSPKPDSDAQA